MFKISQFRLFTKMYYDAFGITSREEFVGTVAKLETEEAPLYIKTLIGSFFKAAAMGDVPALAKTDEMAKRGAQFIAALAKQMEFDGDEIEVVLSGSMHTKLPNDAYIEKLHEYAQQMSGRKLKFIKLDKEPVTGCINWIFRQYK